VEFKNEKLTLGESTLNNGVVFRNQIPTGSAVTTQNVLCSELQTAMQNLEFRPQSFGIEFWATQGDLIISKLYVFGPGVTFRVLPVLAAAPSPINRLFLEGGITNYADSNFPVQDAVRDPFNNAWGLAWVQPGEVLAKPECYGGTTLFHAGQSFTYQGSTYKWPTNVTRIQ